MNVHPGVPVHEDALLSFVAVLQVAATGELQPPANVHALVAPTPAEVEQALLLPLAAAVVQPVGGVQPPANEQALEAEAPAAVMHAEELALPALQVVAAAQPAPVNLQYPGVPQPVLSLLRPVQVAVSVELTVHPFPENAHPATLAQVCALLLFVAVVQVVAVTGLHPPVKVHAWLADAPAAVVHAVLDAFAAVVVQVPTGAALHWPEKEQAFGAAAPAAVPQAVALSAPFVLHVLAGVGVHPPPENVQ